MKYCVGQSGFFTKTITETDIYNFAGVCGDFNPVHVNKIYAGNSRFGKQIAHGALVSSFISTVLGMYLPGAGTIYLSQECKYKKPVFIGDTITASVVIQSIDKRKHAELVTKVINQNNEEVIDGRAWVILPEDD